VTTIFSSLPRPHGIPSLRMKKLCSSAARARSTARLGSCPLRTMSLSSTRGGFMRAITDVGTSGLRRLEWTQTTSPVRSSGVDILRGFHWYRTTVELPRSLRARACHRRGRDRRGLRGCRRVPVAVLAVGAKARVSLRSDLTFAIPPGLIKGSTVHIALGMVVRPRRPIPFYTSGAERFGHARRNRCCRRLAPGPLSISIAAGANLPWNSACCRCCRGCIAFVLFSHSAIVSNTFCSHLLRGLSAGSLHRRILAASDRDAPLVGRRWFAIHVVNLCSYLFLAWLCAALRRWILRSRS